MTARTHLVLLAGAALYALALPPFDLAAGAWVALVPLVVLSLDSTPRRAAMLGAVAGFYTSWTVTWWLPQAIAAYFAASLLLGAATISLAYVVAVSSTFGAFAWFVATTRRLRPSIQAAAVAAAWTGLELFRARVLDDPWALLGYTQYRQIGLIQVASLTGVYGVSFLVAFANGAIALVATGRSRRAAAPTAALALTAVSVAWLGGVVAVGVGAAPAEDFRVAIVQPDVAPAHTWTRGYSERQLASTLALAARVRPGTVDLVVWPENSVTLYPEHEPYVRASLEGAARRLGADLVIGAPRDDGHGVTNSARLVRPDGSWAYYDKQRLVPFAETPVGLRSEDARNPASPRHFRAGSRTGILSGGTTLGISICHELLYPETIHPAAASGATLLVNVANDGWLDGGYGVASRQHFAMGVLRAVESRRYLVRAATHGVSGVVDPWGRVIAATQPTDSGVTTALVALRGGTTLYVRFGDWFPAACGVAVVGLLLGGLVPLRRRRPMPIPHAL